MYELNIENARAKAYSTIVAKLSEEHVRNAVASWKYRKPIFSIQVIEGQDAAFLPELALLVEGVLTKVAAVEAAIEETATVEEAVVVEEAAVPEVAAEPEVVVPEPVSEPVVVVAPPPPPKPVDPRNKPGSYATVVWIAQPGIISTKPYIAEITESKQRPWCRMVYKKLTSHKGAYPDLVSKVEVWFEGNLIEEFPPRSTV